MPDSPAIATAKAAANDTDFIRTYGPDETYWTHFLSRDLSATAADFTVALELIERVAPEADKFIAHLAEMRNIAAFSEQLQATDHNVNTFPRYMYDPTTDMFVIATGVDSKSRVTAIHPHFGGYRVQCTRLVEATSADVSALPPIRI